VIRSGAPFPPVARPATVLAVMLVVATAACSHGSANLAGHWKGARSEGAAAAALDAANSYATHMRLDVNGDVITVTTASDAKTDHYTVVSEDKTKTIIATALDGAADPQTFTFPDAKTMKWAVVPGQFVVFTKE